MMLAQATCNSILETKDPKKWLFLAATNLESKVSNDKVRSSMTTNYAAIKIGLEKSRRWGFLRNEHPAGHSISRSGFQGSKVLKIKLADSM